MCGKTSINVVIECKHQHLLDVAQALFFQSRVPLTFWGECLLTATFLINRTSSLLLSNKTPFTLYNKSVDYQFLQVFGNLCFVSTLTSHRTKFSPQAKDCVFVGYSPGIKGYKVYDIAYKQFFFSRDVVFIENVFPFSVTDHLIEDDPYPDLILPRVFTDTSPTDVSPQRSSSASELVSTPCSLNIILLQKMSLLFQNSLQMALFSIFLLKMVVLMLTQVQLIRLSLLHLVGLLGLIKYPHTLEIFTAIS